MSEWEAIQAADELDAEAQRRLAYARMLGASFERDKRDEISDRPSKD